MDYRQQLRDSETLAYEHFQTYTWWQDQALQLYSLDRGYIRDLARDHVWRYDRSPTRELERHQSMDRTLDRAMEQHTPQRQRHDQTITRQIERLPTREPIPMHQRLRQLAAELGREEEMTQGAAVRARLHERDEQERSYGMER
jgi:hypothetical protein